MALTPKSPLIPPTQIPPIDPPPSASLGFQSWASDWRNAFPITHAMTAPDAPLQPNAQSSALMPPGGIPKPFGSAASTPPAVGNLGGGSTSTFRSARSAAANPPQTSNFMAAQNPKGLVQPGNLTIWNRPTIQNADGSHSSELSFSKEDNGKEVLVPSVVDGRFMTPDGKMPPLGNDSTGKYIPTPQEKAMQKQAWNHYLQTGENLGKFDNPPDADAYANVLHNRGDIVKGSRNPMIPPQTMASSAPPGFNPSGMSSAMPPTLPASAAPPVQSQLQADQGRLKQLQTQGSGASQVKNPWLRGLATAGDIAVTALAPHLAPFIPGTTLHNRQLVGQQAQVVGQDQQAQQAAQQQTMDQANLQHTQAETANIPALAELKKAQLSQAYAKIGYRPTLDANGDPTDQFEPDPESQVYQKQQATNDYLSARQELAKAQAALADAKTKNQPILIQQAQQRINTAARNAQTAIGRLGLSEKEYAMHAYGTDGEGNALPGAMLDDNGTPIGTANAANVRPTETERNAAGRAQTMDDIQSRIEAGLKDPEILNYMGPAGGRLAEQQGRLGTLPKKVAEFRNDLVSYGAFQAGLHPVKGIGALQYFDKVMGGLGQTPEELAGKLASNKATSQSVQRVGTPRINPGRNNMQPPNSGISPEGTVVKMADGSTQVKRNGKWVKQ